MPNNPADAIVGATVRLTAPDGVELLFEHYRHGDRQVALVICPGFFQHRRTPRFRQLARRFVEAGVDVVVCDVRGHGDSGGSYTFGQREPEDLKVVLEVVRPQYPKLGVLAFSMGGSIAIQTLAQTHQADGLIAVSAVADLETITLGSVWWPGALRSWWRQLGVPRPFRGRTWHYGKPKALDVVDQLAPMSVLFIHGTRDWLVSVHQSRLLYAKAHEPKRLQLIDTGRHAEELFEDDPEGFVRACCEWFHGIFEPGGEALGGAGA